MHGKSIIYIDQYGQRIRAKTVRELRDQCGGGRVFKIYRDNPKGGALHVGYGVGRRWFNAYVPFERAA